MLERPIQMLENAVKFDPRLGVNFYTTLGHALYNTNQRARAEEIFKVKQNFENSELRANRPNF